MTQKSLIKMQISPIKNPNFEKPSRNLSDRTKAVNREDKRSHRYRDRDFAKFERSCAIEIANAVRKKSLAGVETAIRFFETQPRREREPDR
jgi:hypothetical protein